MNDSTTLKRFLTKRFHARWRHLAAVGALLVLALGLTQLALAQDSVITLQPTSKSAVEGSSSSFVVRATTTNGPMTFQWQRDDSTVTPVTFTNIPNAKRSSLSLFSLTPAHTGDYRVMIANAAGDSVISDVAHLEVFAPPFTRVTEGAIVTDSEGSIAAGWADYDGDDYVDVFVVNSSFGSPVRNSLYRNNRDGTFTKILTNAPATDASIWWYGLWTDPDNDGDHDLHVGGAGASPDKFYRNDGDGTFVQETPAFVTPTSTGEVAAWFDYDNDGWLDVFIPRNNGNDLLFRGSPEGNFQSMSQDQVGSIVAYSSYTGNWPFDYDNDGWPDLWVTPFSWGTANLQCRLHHNEGQGVFREVTDCALATQLSQFSTAAGGHRWIAPAIGDFDNDGDFDVFVGNGQDGYRARLYRNDGSGVFTDVAVDAGVDQPLNAWSATFADYDNDGDLDILVMCAWYLGGDPNLGIDHVIFRNRGDGTFAYFRVGGPQMSENRLSGGYWVDYDNDGFLDLFVVAGNAENEVNYLYHNRLPSTGNSNNWLKVKLIGNASNSMGVGAKIRVGAAIKGSPVQQLRQMMAPLLGDHQAFTAHFGLGDTATIDKLRIEWPSGIVQELKNLAVNQILTVTEARPICLSCSLRPSDGAFVLTVMADPGQRVKVYGSEDLTNWIEVGESTGGGEVTLPTPNGVRFFKAQAVP